jgi:hypothetical protein
VQQASGQVVGSSSSRGPLFPRLLFPFLFLRTMLQPCALWRVNGAYKLPDEQRS